MTPARDRWEEIVEDLEFIISIRGRNDVRVCDSGDVVNALKREHAAIVRAVKRLPKVPGYVDDMLKRNDVLALLAKRKGRTT